jgi:hypothetical protein
MKNHFLFGGLQFCVPLTLLVARAHGQITPQDTVIPNRFEFSSAQYFVSKCATNAVITVRFFPGGRSWSGSVNYVTRDGTAVANQDYVPVNGTLTFSGLAYRAFTVPLTGSPLDPPKTILVVLAPSPFDPDAILTRSNAALSINLPPPPDVAISSGTNGTVVVSWPDDGTEPLLEKLQTSLGTNWGVLAPVPVDSNGRCFYADVPSAGMALYRLRRPQ